MSSGGLERADHVAAEHLDVMGEAGGAQHGVDLGRQPRLAFAGTAGGAGEAGGRCRLRAAPNTASWLNGSADSGIRPASTSARSCRSVSTTCTDGRTQTRSGSV